MSNPNVTPEVKLLDAVIANTVSTPLNISDYNVITVNLFATSAAASNGTIKIYASNQEVAPTIGTPSASNMYFRVAMKELGTETSYTSSSEFTLGASATHNKGFNVQLDGARWLWAELSTVSGTVAVTISISGRKT